MLKRYTDSYLCLDDNIRQIKFKKDYIVELENIVNFVIINNCRDVKDETELYIKKLS